MEKWMEKWLEIWAGFWSKVPLINRIPGFNSVPPGVMPADLRYYMLSNLVLTLGMFIHASWVALFGYLGIAYLLYANLISVAVYIGSIIINRKGFHFASSAIMVLEIVFHQYFSIGALGWAAGFQYYILVIALFPFLMPKGRWLAKSALLAACLIGYVLYDVLYSGLTPIYDIEGAYDDYLKYTNIVFSFISLSISGAYFNIAMHQSETTILGLVDDLQGKNALLNQKNEEIMAQREAIQTALDTIEAKNRKITNSIVYAKRIQSAVLPSLNVMDAIFPENFILFMPRDIVSGDFYFIKEIEGKVCVIAADCTGHGVPGAFMSMLGTAFLNEIVLHKKNTKAGDILEELRKQVKEFLQQTGKSDEQKDGMDIAICIIDTPALQMSFAGAYNPLWLFRKAPAQGPFELLETKADKMPVGVFVKETPFAESIIHLQKEDVFYIFSDGYHSQFGGEKDEKFKSGPFKKLLSEICGLPMKKQKEILENTLLEWKGNKEQTDDILVVGVKIS